MTAGLDIEQYLDAEPGERWDVPIEHLSASSVSMFKRCPEQFRQRYILGRKERPGEGLVVGTAVHLTAEKNFLQKVASYEDIPAGELITWYDDVAFPTAISEREQQGDEVAWDTGPDGARRRGRAITVAYHGQVAPRVQPLSVETRVEADIGLAVPLIGYADCITAGPVIDIKTAKQARRKIKPEWRIQAAVYSTLTEKPVDFHCVSATAKGLATVNTPLESAELSLYLPEVARENTLENIRSTAWLMQYLMEKLGPDKTWPTDGQSHTWACDFCGYRPSCPAWKGIDP